MPRPATLLAALLAVAFAPAADPPKAERPDPKLYPEKWAKDGVTVELEEAYFGKDDIGIHLRVTNGTKDAITLRGQWLDEVFLKTTKPDKDSPIKSLTLTDALGTASQALAWATAIKDDKDGRALKAGGSGIITLIFQRPAVSGRYFLTIPANASGLPHEVRVSIDAGRFTPDKPKR